VLFHEAGPFHSSLSFAILFERTIVNASRREHHLHRPNTLKESGLKSRMEVLGGRSEKSHWLAVNDQGLCAMHEAVCRIRYNETSEEQRAENFPGEG
jgi:hypothetical protein